jgi:hypothetical protein
MRVIPIPVRQDNYSYLIVDDTAKEAAAVDPYTPSKVKEAADQLGIRVIAGLTTHHHHDHSGGNQVCSPLPQSFVISSDLLTQEFVRALVTYSDIFLPALLIFSLCVAADQAQLFPGVQIYGGSHQSPALTQLVKGEDQFTLGNSLNVRSGFLHLILLIDSRLTSSTDSYVLRVFKIQVYRDAVPHPRLDLLLRDRRLFVLVRPWSGLYGRHALHRRLRRLLRGHGTGDVHRL